MQTSGQLTLVDGRCCGIPKFYQRATILSMVRPGRVAAPGLTDLAAKILQADGFAEVAAALARGESAAVDGAWGSSCALSVAALAETTEQTLVVVLPRPSDLDDFAADLLGFMGTAP